MFRILIHYGILTVIVFVALSQTSNSSEYIDFAHSLSTQISIEPSVVSETNIISKNSSADRVALILARPLSEPGRRPSAPAQAQKPVQVMPRLAGIMITPERSVAIFQQVSSPRPIVLKTGDVLEGIWNIASIAAGEVSLAHDDTVLVLTPHSAANRDPPNPEPTRSWKIGLRRSDPMPSYLKRLQ